MKKLIIALFAVILPLSISAQTVKNCLPKRSFKPQQEDAAYLKGAVPEVDGKVVFTREVSLPGKSKDMLFKAVCQWASLRYEAKSARGEWDEPDFFKNTEYSKVKTADNGVVEAQGAEEMVFTNRTLAKDYTLIDYTMRAKVDEGKVTLTISNIIYVYAGSINERMTAEEYINDANAFNKKGELRKQYGKFRVRTIDLVKQLADEIAKAAE